MAAKPNVILKITPEGDGYSHDVVFDEIGIEPYLEECELYEIDEIIDNLKLQNRRAPYLLMIYEAELEQNVEYDEGGWETGWWYTSLSYKAVKAARVKKETKGE